MADTDSSGWDKLGSLATNLIYEWGKAKIAAEARPPAPAPTPAPVYPGVSNVYPAPAWQAQASTVGQQLGEIFMSPRTWLAISAVALVVVLVKLRR